MGSNLRFNGEAEAEVVQESEKSGVSQRRQQLECQGPLPGKLVKSSNFCAGCVSGVL